ncbi:MAG: TlpA family protein disulfide reductase [Clostridia bacterium]|nr:TlpA family protein disulfide reductase [Clostridia bacterium]
MTKKLTVLLVLLGFILLTAGATLLYNTLTKNTPKNQLLVHSSPEQPQAVDSSNSKTAQTEAPEDGEKIDSETETASDESNEVVIPTARVPDFTVYDSEGNAVRFSDLLGKPTVLNFWASWCGPCRSEMPDFEEKYLELSGEVSFVMVNLTSGSRETLSAAKSFIADRGYTFPVYFDTEGDAALAYQVYSIPTTFFIDAEGNLVAQATGAIDAETLQAGIDLIK